MNDTLRIEDHALRVTIDEAIHRRLMDRRWYRRNRDMAHWGELVTENDIALRELLRVRRLARVIAAPIIAREDAITRAKAEALRAGDFYAWPDEANVEGMPEFNGAFR